ncbi:MAG: hypothetical protein VW711_11425, partial [Verrucomicrobiales bacterium]
SKWPVWFRSQMLYPVELPVHSEEIDTMSLAINKVNAFEGLEGSLIINNENFGLLKNSVWKCGAQCKSGSSCVPATISARPS